MGKKFKGSDLIDALRRQILVSCDDRIAKRIAKNALRKEFKPGQKLIKQNDKSSELFLILQGSVDVFVNGRCVGSRPSGEHVGEMAAILKSRRTATVVAKEHCVVAILNREQFLALADDFPKIWRALSEQLAQRLDKRRNQIREQNAKPYVFIGSSTKQKDVALRLQTALEDSRFDVRVWSEPGVFEASDTFIETLTKETEKADFAVLVFGKDDIRIKGNIKEFIPRDNVVFEAGLFIGSISRKRTFIASPRGVRVKILSDLDGMTRLQYTKKSSRISQTRKFGITIDVSEAAASIRARILKDWVR